MQVFDACEEKLEDRGDNVGTPRSFSRFRVVMTGVNSIGGNEMALSGFEVYGTVMLVSMKSHVASRKLIVYLKRIACCTSAPIPREKIAFLMCTIFHLRRDSLTSSFCIARMSDLLTRTYFVHAHVTLSGFSQKYHFSLLLKNDWNSWIPRFISTFISFAYQTFKS